MAVKGAVRSHRQRKEAAEARAEAQAARGDELRSSSDDDGDERAAKPKEGIKMDLKDLVDMGKTDPSDLPQGADAVPLLPDGSVRRWPTANENHTTVTEGQIHFLPAVASDFDEGTELGEAARMKFQVSVAASLGITPECIRITDVQDVSFLEAVQELARREEQEQLLAELDDPEEAEQELYELRMKHGKTRFKQAVKKWRKREKNSADLKISRVRRRKEKLERLLDELEHEHDAGKPEESDFVPERRHSIDNGTDPEKRLLDSKRKEAPGDPNGDPAATTLAVSPAAPAGTAEQQPTEAKRSAANPYGLSAELLKAKLEFDQKRRATVALGKFTCRHQLRGGWLDESGLEPAAAVLTAVVTRVLLVVLICLLLAGLPHQDSHELSSAQHVKAGLRPVEWTKIENGTISNASCWQSCAAALQTDDGGGGDWGFVHVLLRQSIVYILVLLLAAWHDYRVLDDPEALEASQLEIFRGLCSTDRSWRMPLGLAFSSPGVGGRIGCVGHFLASSFVALSMAVFFLAASGIAADAVAPLHQLRFLPGATHWELLLGRADCACSYVWTKHSGTGLSRWLLHHSLSLVTVWHLLVMWWRVYGGYLSSTWIVSGNYTVKVVASEAAGAFVFDVQAVADADEADPDQPPVAYYSGDFVQTIREGSVTRDGAWPFWKRTSEMGVYALLLLSAAVPILLRGAVFSAATQ